MSDWNYWEWLGYVSTWIAAIVIAIGGAIRAEPRVRRRLPIILKTHYWAFIPVALMLIGSMGFLLGYNDKQWEPITPIMLDYGTDTPITIINTQPPL